MAWTLLDAGTAVFADGSAGHVYTYPGGAPAAGDLLVLAVNSDTVVATPPGWTLAVTDVANQGAYVWYRTAGAGEPAAVTVTTSGNFNAALSYRRYAGAAAVPLDVTDKTRAGSPASVSPPVDPVLTGSGELCLLYAMCHRSLSTLPMANPTPSAGYTLLADTGVLGALNTVQATQHYVIGRTDGTGAQTPSVDWDGSSFNDITALFVAFTAPAVSIVELGGTAGVTVAASGTPSRTRALAGTAAVAFSAAGTGTRQRTLAGAAAVAISASGSPCRRILLAGTSAVHIAAVGTLRGNPVRRPAAGVTQRPNTGTVHRP